MNLMTCNINVGFLDALNYGCYHVAWCCHVVTSILPFLRRFWSQNDLKSRNAIANISADIQGGPKK